MYREKKQWGPSEEVAACEPGEKHQKKQSRDCGLLSSKTRKNKFLLYKLHSVGLVPLSRIRKWKENEEWFYSSSCAINCFRVHGIRTLCWKGHREFLNSSGHCCVLPPPPVCVVLIQQSLAFWNPICWSFKEHLLPQLCLSLLRPIFAYSVTRIQWPFLTDYISSHS